MSDASASVRANALLVVGRLAWSQGDYGRAAVLCEEGMRLFRELGDKEADCAPSLDIFPKN